MNTGPVIIVDDDAEDFDILQAAWKETNMGNELILFQTGDKVLEYLNRINRRPSSSCVMLTCL